jgi:hypothetical protein
MTADPVRIPDVANPLSPVEPQALNKPKLLVGEGKDEVNFFEALLRHSNVSDVQLEQCEGKTRLSYAPQAPRLLESSGYRNHARCRP